MYAFFVSILICWYSWSTSPRYFGSTSIPMLHVLESPTNILVNRNQTGLTSGLLFTIIYYKLNFKELKFNLLNFVILVTSVLSIMFSFSKGAWILSFISFCIIISLKFKLSFRFVILINSLILTIFLVQNFYIDFWASIDNRLAQSGETNSYRLQYIYDSLNISYNNLLVGIGPGNYYDYTLKYGYDVTVDPHNSYLQTFAELGIFGLIFLILILYKLLNRSYINQKHFNYSYLIFLLVMILVIDGFQSGLSLTMKLLYIFMGLTFNPIYKIYNNIK